MTRPSYLMAVASSCQMYSGTGTVIFDWIRFARDSFRFAMFMDVENELNFRIVSEFCRHHGVPLYSSPGLALPGCIDSGMRGINEHLLQHGYDFVECVSWASSSTNLNVLASRRQHTRLVYTPHSQPLWTLPQHERYFMTSPAFVDTLRAADAVFVDSPAEYRLDGFASIPREKVHVVPLGVDTELYSPSDRWEQAHRVLCVCDCREKRKRVDVVLAAFALAHAKDPRLHLVVGGKGSDTLSIPRELADAVTVMGYIELRVLVDLYRTASLFVLLSDYEAFGLPIAEALCCGCPVLLNGLSVLKDVFSPLPGATFTDNDDLEATAKRMVSLATGVHDRSAIAKRAREVFSFEATYGRKRAILLEGAHRLSVA
ncbi:MAG TPA: glycosyltransferase family 4 protein [Anaeromyxobacter sp.]